MTAPDPTAGGTRRARRRRVHGNERGHGNAGPGDLPMRWRRRRATRTGVGPADQQCAWTLDLCRTILASDWLAAREAAARAEERERIVQAIEARAAVAESQRRNATTTVAHDASDEHAWAFHRAARIAREAG